jgi:hypothetical protein
MNEQDNAPLESPSGDSDTPPPTADTHADCVTKMIELEQVISNLRARIHTLSNEQIMGDDHRLIEFWEKAQELADRAGHCSVYDEIAEALGGPAREREYDVTVTYSARYTVTARDEQSAIDYATEAIEDVYTIGDLNVENAYAEES